MSAPVGPLGTCRSAEHEDHPPASVTARVQAPLAERNAWRASPGAAAAADGGPAGARARRAEPDGSLCVVHGSGDLRSGRLRALRAELQWRREGSRRGDVVVLLSPCAGEGRSQLAADLAISFAQSGHRTLLVDADLRSPRQHTLFGVANAPGLAQAIAGDGRPCLHEVRGLPRLSLLTAGATPADPMPALCSVRFRDLLGEWRDAFDQVVIDTAPAGAHADGLAVAGAAGRVLAISRARHTPLKDLQQMLTRLAAVRAQVLGAVISHH